MQLRGVTIGSAASPRLDPAPRLQISVLHLVAGSGAARPTAKMHQRSCFHYGAGGLNFTTVAAAAAYILTPRPPHAPALSV